MSYTHTTAPTRFVEIDGLKYAYRRWGKEGTTPVLFIPHFRAGMDHWDPIITDSFAQDREVILFDGRGIAATVARSGLRNLTERAQRWGGATTVRPLPEGGTSLSWHAPLPVHQEG